MLSTTSRVILSLILSLFLTACEKNPATDTNADNNRTPVADPNYSINSAGDKTALEPLPQQGTKVYLAPAAQ
jgi:hypothetical protein